MPKPPPGYKQNRTKGFPLEDLDTLFGHVLNALGPDLAAARNRETLTGAGRENGKASAGGSAGSKRARSQGGDEGGGKRRSGDLKDGPAKKSGADRKGSVEGRSPMEVDAGSGEGKAGGSPSGVEARSDLDPGPPPSDPAQEGLEAAKKAFSRVLGVWDGVAMEGKRALHHAVVARVGRMLAQAEAAAAARGKVSESQVGNAPRESKYEVCFFLRWVRFAPRLFINPLACSVAPVRCVGHVPGFV